MSHTPGPWFLPDYYRCPQPVYYKPKAGKRHVICVMDSHGPTDEQDEANARLIAAAPDLLEALKYVRTFKYVRDNAINDSVGMWNMVDRAIIKAEGKQ